MDEFQSVSSVFGPTEVYGREGNGSGAIQAAV